MLQTWQCPKHFHSSATTPPSLGKKQPVCLTSMCASAVSKLMAVVLGWWKLSMRMWPLPLRTGPSGQAPQLVSSAAAELESMQHVASPQNGAASSAVTAAMTQTATWSLIDGFTGHNLLPHLVWMNMLAIDMHVNQTNNTLSLSAILILLLSFCDCASLGILSNLAGRENNACILSAKTMHPVSAALSGCCTCHTHTHTHTHTS